MIKIEDIKSPDFLKDLSVEEMNRLASDIREFLIQNVSRTGGHLSSNLGMVEVTIALHYVFSSPHDKLIFDVGHQGYTHKILTGRAKDFSTLREKNGLSGFLKYSESPHDVWEAGHSSTSISAASGFLEAKTMGADIGEVVAIIGDGSVQNGLALSALNYLGSKKNQKVIIILNDNNMSISRNVGSLSKVLDSIRIRRPYNFLKRITPRFVDQLIGRSKTALNSYLHGNHFLSSVGFRYFGPIDGHNIRCLIQYFEYAKKTDHSVILHLKTVKGKGYKFSEEDDQGIWHGIGPFDIETGNPLGHLPDDRISWSNGISSLILQEAKQNPKIKVITAAMIQGTGLDCFQRELPQQLIDVGISEEHAVVMASAMARCGMIPIVSIYSTFLQRAYDEINHDVSRSNTHVVFLLDRAGIVGQDGSTHQGIYDIAYLSHLPNMVIAMPKDLNEAKSIIHIALYFHDGPFAIRYPRGTTRKVCGPETEVPFGSWETVLPHAHTNIISYGPVIHKFASLIQESGKAIGLINARYIKPLDKNVLMMLNHTRVIIYEEVEIHGSLSALILEEIAKEHLDIAPEIIGIDDQIVKHGTIKEIKKDLGLDIRELLEKL